MKKLLFSIILIASIFIKIQAQYIDESVIILDPSVKGETNTEAVKEVENNVKLPQNVEMVLSRLLQRDPKWQVKEEEEGTLSDPEYIDLHLKGVGETTEVRYDRRGNLVRFETVTQNPVLPDPVNQALQMRFANWQVVKDKKVFNIFSKNTDVYVVKIQNGHHKKTLRLDDNGTFLNRV
jgi:hypothetical protein